MKTVTPLLTGSAWSQLAEMLSMWCCPARDGTVVESLINVHDRDYPLAISVDDRACIDGLTTSRLTEEDDVDLPRGRIVSVDQIVEQSDLQIRIDARTSEDLGLDVDDGGGSNLLVLRVHHGVFQEWNEAQPENSIRHGDRIISVNGVKGSATALLHKLCADEILILSMERPAEYVLRVERSSVRDKFGVDVAISGGRSLVVRQVLGGLLGGGDGDKPALQVGDRILAVNDVAGDANVMLKELSRQPCVDIRFSRWNPDWKVARHIL